MDEGDTRTASGPGHALGVSLAVDPEEQLATRAAWLYFVAGLTQAQIGKKLGLNRTRVNRLLAQARDQGLVQINITGRLASCVELEEKLKQRIWPRGRHRRPHPARPGADPAGHRHRRRGCTCRRG